MPDSNDRPAVPNGHGVPSPNAQPLPSPSGSVPQQPAPRNLNSRPDVANPYAANPNVSNPYAANPNAANPNAANPNAANPNAAQQQPAPQQRQPQGQPPGNPYAAGQASTVPPANPYTQPSTGSTAAQNPYAPTGYPPGTPSQPQASAASSSSPLKKSRGKRWFVLVAVLVVGGGAAVAAFVVKPSFLGFTKVFDHFAVEKTIEHQSAGLFSDVSCPAGEKAKAGVTFQCSAANGKKVNVVVKDSSGNYVWIPAN